MCFICVLLSYPRIDCVRRLFTTLKLPFSHPAPYKTPTTGQMCFESYPLGLSVCLEPVKWYSSYPLLVCVTFLKGNADTIHDITYFLISGPSSSSQYDNSLINTLHVFMTTIDHKQDSTKPIKRCLSERMEFMLFRCTNPITMAGIGSEGWLMLFD